MSRNNTKQNKQSITKNTCKSMLRLSAVATLIGMPVATMAGTIELGLNNYSYSANGEAAGEFTASDTGLNPSALGYSPNTSTSTTFETFCVQNSVYVSTGTPYSYTEAQVTGGPTGGPTEGGIALSEGVAYLYYEFATGNLSGYNYGNTATRNQDAGELQAAIWYFMGEPALSGWPSTSGNQFITLAEDNVGNAFATNGTGGQTDYGVAILQLTSGSVVEQNQLILTVPDGGMTLAMLGMGLAGLFYVNFRRTKSVARQN
jgi:hypothetical protein